MRVLRIYHAGRDAAHRERDRALVEAGVDLTLVVPATWPGPDELTDEPFEIVQLDIHRPGDVNRHTYVHEHNLKAVIDRVRPDVVDLHEEPFSAVTHQVLRLLDPGQTVVGYTAQNIDKRFPPPYSVWERQALSRWTGMYPCANQAASVAVGKGYRGQVSVLPLAPAAAMTPGEQSPPTSELRLLLVGRMVAAKGIFDAVRVLARLPYARLHLVGEGPDLANALALAGRLGVSDRLDVSPWLNASDLADCYRSAHVLLAPSRSTATWVEQFGRMVVEAQACGTVVVAYASGALPEVVGDAGVLVPEGDEIALHKALDTMTPERWSDLRELGLKASEHRTWGSVAAAQRALYEAAFRTQPRDARPQRAAARARWGTPALNGKRLLAMPARVRAALSPDPAPRDRPLRVVYLDHVARKSGGELALLRLLPSLPDVEAHVILAEDGPLRPALEEVGATVEVLPMLESARDLRRGQVVAGRSAATAGLASAAYSVRLARRLREINPDLVHANSLKSGFYGGVAARAAGVPMIWHVRDRVADDYLPPQAVAITRWALRTFPRAVIANSNATLGTTRLKSRRRRSTSVIPSVVSYSSQLTIGDAIEPRRTPHASDDAVIGIVGRLADWKGQDVFLRALAALLPEHPDLRGRIVGSAMFGEDTIEAELRTLAEDLGITDRVTFVGFTEDVAGELAKLQILVHASTLPEPFGQVIVEGMAAGIPVIATVGGGASEIIDDGRTGILVPPGDVDALVDALDRLLRDPDTRASLAAAGLDRADDFKPAAIGPVVRGFYDQILGA